MAKEDRTNLAVEAKNLIKVFGDNRAVDGVNLEVPEGCIYGVLGPNGAGKTTVINILATLLKADGGIAKVFGHDVKKEPQVVRQLIGLTGQSASVDEALSATENLVIFSRLLGLSKKESKKKASELLEEFSLSEAAKRPLSKFSGGMRRRLDLAASLIAQPPLIFLDEPTTGLDPRTRNQMWDTIRRLVTNGSTVLLTTQYLDEADQLADRIAVIDQGKVVAEGTPNELKESVGLATLQLQLTHDKDISKALEIVQAILKTKAQAVEPLLVTAPMADPEKITDLLIDLRKSDIHLAEVSVQKPTLDEVFLTITGHDTKPKKKKGKS
ncbi:MAG: ATP-binding cassette domain-containing protein [Candidatus Saccharibacteria bacterium]